MTRQSDNRLVDAAGRPWRRLFDLKTQDFEDRLVSGALTSDGIQWGTAFTTTEVGVLQEAFIKTIDPGIDGDLLWLELGLTHKMYASADNSAGKWQWQARNKDGTWVDLHTIITEADIDTSGTGVIERTRQGFFTPATNIKQVPFDIRLMIQCDTATKTVSAQVKSSSYARAVYEAH
ncbi:MAG: hypothetical protein V1724_04390 [Chloroflexota bacterium]